MEEANVVADFEGVCSGDIYVLEPANGSLPPDLLPFICQTDAFFEYAVGTSAGSLSPRTNWRSLADFEFVLPPLEEQRHACELLQAVEAVVQAAHDAVYWSGAVAVRAPESIIDPSWPQVRVGELLTEPPRNGVSPNCNDEQRGRPTLSIGCVYSGVVDTKNDLKFAEIDVATFERFHLQPADILVVRGNGNRRLVGRAGIVTENETGCFFPDLLIRLRFDDTRLVPELAASLWNAIPVHGALITRAKSTNGIFKINSSDIREHRLPVPPRNRQPELIRQQHLLRTHLERRSNRNGREIDHLNEGIDAGSMF